MTNGLPGHLQHILDNFNRLPEEQRRAVIDEQIASFGKDYKPGERQAQAMSPHPDHTLVANEVLAGMHAELRVLRTQRMQPERERELLHANNRYLERARAAERAAKADPWQVRAAWVATQILLWINAADRKGAFDDTGTSLDHQIKLLQCVAAKQLPGGKSLGDLGYATAALVMRNLITTELVCDWVMTSEEKFPEDRQPLSFQQRVFDTFTHICKDDPTDENERGARFFEEATELMQALGWKKQDLHDLVGYVFGRAKGEPMQEMGGTYVTLAGLATYAGLDMVACGERELERCNTPEAVLKIRQKRASRPRDGSPLPGKATEPDFGLVYGGGTET